MSQITKNAITASTLKLAALKPVHKITVRDIVNDCGITRNTFYYHYKDIYDVLDQVLSAEIEKATTQHSTHEENDQAFFGLAHFVLNHKAVLKNLYLSMGDTKATAYLSGRLHETILRYVQQEAADLPADTKDLDIIALFYEEALLGILLRWLRGDMPPEMPADIFDIFGRISSIFGGQVRDMVKNSLHSKDSANF